MSTNQTDGPTKVVLPIYQTLLDEVDAETRELVIAMLGTQQDSRALTAKQDQPGTRRRPG